MCVCACVCHPSTQFMCDVYYIIPFGLQTQPTWIYLSGYKCLIVNNRKLSMSGLIIEKVHYITQETQQWYVYSVYITTCVCVCSASVGCIYDIDTAEKRTVSCVYNIYV